MDPKAMLSISPHETTFIEAFRALPLDSATCAGVVDPIRHLRAMMALVSRFFEVANRNAIEYWLEDGLLSGYLMFKSVIPWQTVVTVGCTTANFRRFREVGDDDAAFGFKLVEQPGCDTPAFCFYAKDCEECRVIIAEYAEVGEALICAAADWGLPPHARSDVFPVRRGMMLGQLMLLPANPSNFIARGYTMAGKRSSDGSAASVDADAASSLSLLDPTAYLLSHICHPTFFPKALEAPVFDIPVARTIAEGFDRFARAQLPFIVKAVTAFDIDIDAFHARMRSEGTTTWGWSKQLQEVRDVPVAWAMDEWQRGALKLNFVDAGIPKMVANAGIHADLRAMGINEDNLMLAMTNRGGYTPFHQDPFVGEGKGAGWMWLQRGCKVWNFIKWEHSEYFYDADARSVADYGVADLMCDNDSVLWGRMGQCVAEAGDFVYFPPACNHRVWTYEDSIGVCGYSRQAFDEQAIAEAAKWYGKIGVSPEDGFFQIVPNKRAAIMAMAQQPRHDVEPVGSKQGLSDSV